MMDIRVSLGQKTEKLVFSPEYFSFFGCLISIKVFTFAANLIITNSFVTIKFSVYLCVWKVFISTFGRNFSSVTVLCKSNASEFRQISWLFLAFQRNFASNEISATILRTFKASIVFFLPNFRTIICGGR